MAFNISLIDENEENIYYELKGDLDISSASYLEKKILDDFDEKSKNIVLDFSHLDFIDSMGIGALVSLYRKAIDKNKYVKINKANSNIRKVFSICDLSDIFGIN